MEQRTGLPKFSVLITVYNGEGFVGETIEAVLAQSHPPAEILVIDDGSTDRTPELVRNFAGKVTLHSRPNLGVSEARNYGLSIASSEWVAMLDHDDLWEPGHLEGLAHAIARDPEAALCYSGIRDLLFDPAERAFRPVPPRPLPTPDAMPAALMNANDIIPSQTAVRKSFVQKVGGFDPYFINGQDWDLWLRMVHAGARFAHSPQATLLYRIHTGSHSHKVNRAVKFYCEIVWRDIFPYLPWYKRYQHALRVVSRLEFDGARRLRRNGLTGALPLTLRSIFHYPFGNAFRYKLAAYLMLRGDPNRTPPQASPRVPRPATLKKAE